MSEGVDEMQRDTVRRPGVDADVETSSDTLVDTDVDVLVVGSGFGGSVTALRLAEKGYRVRVLEAGRRFEDDDFAKTSWDVRNFLWAPKLGCYGIQRIHRLRDVMILAGAGVGGGSLIYATPSTCRPAAFFRDPQWGDITDWQAELAPHYDQAKRMLGVVTNPCDGPVEDSCAQAADDLGSATRSARPRSASSSARPARRVGATPTSAARARSAPAAPSAATAWPAAGTAPRTPWSRTTSRSPSSSAS